MLTAAAATAAQAGARGEAGGHEGAGARGEAGGHKGAGVGKILSRVLTMTPIVSRRFTFNILFRQ